MIKLANLKDNVVWIVGGLAVGMVAHQMLSKQGKGEEFIQGSVALAGGAIGHKMLAAKGIGPFGGGGFI